MKLTKEQEAEVMPIYKEWWHSYLNGDVKTYGHYLDDDYRFVGSTVAEDFLNKRDTTQFFDATADQLAGKTQKRNSKLTTEYYDGVVFITELADAYLLFGDEWTFYGKFRFSSMLRKRNDGWRFIYQHFSVPDSKAQEGETIGFEQVSKENQELRDAIKRRTAELENKNRELEIEAALERVRAQSMAMQQPDDLNKVNKELLTQLKGLKIDGLTGVSIWLLDEDGMVTAWDLSNPGNMGNPSSAMVHYNPEKFDILGEPWRLLQESDADYFVLNYSVEKLEKAINEWAEVDRTVADGFREALANGNLKHQWNPIARHSNGILSIDLINPPLGDTKEIVTKMANAFSLAYTRFLDLQKAEAQAREAQIEMALEKVRSRTMAMQSSDELTETASEMFRQIEGLGLNPWSCGFNIFNDDKTVISQWVSTGDGRPIEPFDTPATEGIFKRIVEQSENDEPLYIEKMEGEKLEDTYKYMASLPTLDKIFEELDAAGIELPKKQVDHAAYFKHGYLMFITYEETPEFHPIFKRFAKVFEQTYTRFLDLQKAEEQARESEIQLALERVRARSMAMHKSDELADLSLELVKQVQALGIDTWFCAFNIYDDHPEGSIEWGSNGQGTFSQYRTPREGIFLDYYEAGQRGETLLINEIGEEECPAHYDYLCSLPGVSDQLLKMKDEGIPFPTSQIDHVAFFNYGYILFITFEPAPQAHDIFKRFAKVFQQTYTRFLDLHKSEEQAKEAQVEAALERVRAQAMAMHHTEDLGKTIEVYFEQLDSLIDSTIVRCGAGLLNKENRIGEMSTASRSADGEIYSVNGFIDMRGHPLLDSSYEHWLMQKEHSYVLRGNKIREYYQYIANKVAIPENAGTDELHFYFPMFTEGSFYVVTERKLPEDELNIFRRFSSVLSLTYRRFNDLKKAEAQAREAQIEAALERVRAKAMSMQNSDELDEVLSVLCEQFDVLGILPMSTHMTVFNFDNNTFTFRETGKYGDRSFGEQTVDLDAMDTWKETVDKWKADKATAVNKLHFPKETLPEVWEVFHESFASMPEESRITPKDYPDGIYHTAGKHPFGYIGMNQVRPATGEEEEIVIKFANEFGRAYQRFLDLQKAEEQAREAKIETALEKIRSRTMAMQKGEELQDVAVLLYKELIALGVTNFVTCGYVEVNEDIQRQHTWVTAPGGDTMGLFHLPLTGDDTFDARYAAWKKQQTVFHQSVAGQVRSDHLEYAITTFNSKEAEEMVRSQFPDPTVFYCFNFSHGYLHTVGGSLLEKEEEKLLARFTKVFEQTYTRFLDLQKAEEQAREAKIETALEKVRSRTMGMQSSDELQEVANVLFGEMNDLVQNLWTCGFVLCERGREEDEWWLSLEDGFSRGFFLPNVNDYAHATLYEGWLKGDAFRTVQLDGDKLQAHYDWLMQIPVAKNIFDEMEAAGMERPEWQKLHAAYFSKGYLVIITREPCPEEEIFRRFATVFDQTYTRFLDLKKAEAQARESQIEAALEKVRSRSLAMQSPDELIEVAQLLREEMGALGVEELETSSIYIHDETSGNTQCWFTIKDSDSGKAVTDQMTIDLQDTWVGREMINFYRSDTKDTSILMQGEQRLEWIGYCGEKSKAFTPEGFYGESIPERTYHLHKFSNGYIGAASSGDISNESWDLLKRATSVFSFAYTRFCDLQKAETRARESRIELALERIRAQVASMQESSDLFDIVVGMRNEFLALGHEADYFWHMRWLPDSYEMSMTSEDGSRIGMVISLPKFVHDEIPALAEWEKGDDPIYVLALDAKGAWSYIESMNTHGDYELADPSAPGKEDIEHIGGLTFIMARTTHGEIGYGLPGMVPEPPKDALDTLVRFAGVFDLAYKRFEDLKAAERQALMIREERDRLEIALKELHATQDQLVQQEKLASLGQLTAGIAHEIKNPLNFVNNFSEVSLELVEEVLEEVKTHGHASHGHASHGHASEDHASQQTITEILIDIKSNLTKIHEHGSRADNIVKSMLQHSRGGAGKMESTDLNALIKEYVNLSFHGMRAGKNPINVDIQLDLDDSMGKVNLIGEDFSRVILNLCNNAFDALKSVKTQRHASLNVRTKKSDNSIAIEIEDNGPGIPDEIKDKILQPFFTTKKGTAGTGLGLSITNDIIKAHGGTLDIQSQPGQTVFIIKLNES